MSKVMAFEQIYEDNAIQPIMCNLRDAEQLADKQSFGMYREENTKEFIKKLTEAKNRIETLLKRLS